MSFMERPWVLAASLGLATAVAGCSATTTPVPSTRNVALSSHTALYPLESGAGKIRHVVWVIQENRSFNNLFKGYPGAYTVSAGKDSKGDKIPLAAVSLKTAYVINHSAGAMFVACDGKGKLPGTKCRMDGFDQEGAGGSLPYPEYVYVPRSESKPYWDTAHEWVLADKMFQTQIDDSFVAHQYAIAAQAHSSVDVPSGKWGCEGGKSDRVGIISQQRTLGDYQRACFNYQTLGDELDQANLEWRFYTSKYQNQSGGIWSAYQAVRHRLRAGLEERHNAAEEISHGRSRRKACELHVDHAALPRLRSHRRPSKIATV